MPRRTILLASLGCAALLAPGRAHAGPAWTDAQRVDTALVQTPVSGVELEQDDQFGWSADVTGETVIIGAPGQNAVYRFERDGRGGWVAGPALTGTAVLGNSEFGRAVAASGDLLAVAAPYDAGFSGQGFVHLFERRGDAFVERAQITAANGAVTEHFGSEIALDGGTLAASYQDGVQIFVGAGDTWTLQATLELPGETTQSLALDGDLLVVGLPGEAVRGLDNAGAVHVFERAADTWS